ncbi:MAG: putative lipid II flippase FtsW [Deltaproteobacteria bacterium]|jgi:cell division protein FtsW|nr:putative lipid II flippase FtsW [Deltaproteobacteria bacterium]
MKKSFVTPLDGWLLLIIMALVGLGSVVLFSASFGRGEHYYHNPYYYFQAHLRNLLVGGILMLILSQFPYQRLLKLSWPIGGLAVLMLLAVLHPAFYKATLGSGRWLKHVPFQPSEAAKLAAVIMLARYFARIGDLKTRFWHGFAVPCLVIVLFGGLIVCEKDLGGALVVFGVVLCLMISAGVRGRHLSWFLALAPAIWALIFFYKHRVSRFLGWDNPWLYPRHEGYSIIHSFYAFAEGGLAGTGIGQGQQKMFFLPMAHTDYIFSILGEELGLIGVAGVAALFILFASRGLSIAMAARTPGGRHLAVGAVLIIMVPAVINMMVALSIIPAKGLPLPFFSYGGSSMAVSLASLGILLNIAGQALKESEPPLVVNPYDR